MKLFGQVFPYQDYTIYLVPAVTGLILGLLIILIIILPLFLWLRHRKKARLAALQPDQAPTIPIIPPADKEDTKPTLPVIETETVESVTVITVDEPLTLPASGQRPAEIGWQIAGLTDVGLKRDLNEDSLLMLEGERPDLGPYGLYAVADGMGGHEKGEIASQLTLAAIRAQFGQPSPIPAETPVEEWLQAASLAANQAVLSRQDPNSPERKMGSTLVMALIAGQQAHIANIGDSRAYYLSQKEIEQITEDHSLVERLVQIGQLTREEARVHRQRNVIYNTIGDKENPQVSLYHLTLQPGDRLLLCSDGLNNMITDEQILEFSRQHASPAEACKAMVAAAKSAGGVDNITAILIQMNAP
ncbi:MAG: Stp1/IreP family PP2C-type Ser/Thr phosphatase [Anaerolineae bacterium]|nr:Stp1/IreP family PP2C-type Ser/Thr phosphatase [Anaerolineae bacterium]